VVHSKSINCAHTPPWFLPFGTYNFTPNVFYKTVLLPDSLPLGQVSEGQMHCCCTVLSGSKQRMQESPSCTVNKTCIDSDIGLTNPRQSSAVFFALKPLALKRDPALSVNAGYITNVSLGKQALIKLSLQLE